MSQILSWGETNHRHQMTNISDIRGLVLRGGVILRGDLFYAGIRDHGYESCGQLNECLRTVGRICFKKQGVSGLQSEELVIMSVLDNALEHVNGFNTIMLKGRKSVGFFG